MEKIKLNTLQTSILNTFKTNEYFKNMSIIHQKTRISFKEGRLNYFILFPREGLITLHINLRKYKNDENIFNDFKNQCFNNAKQYVEKQILTIEDAEEVIKLFIINKL